MSKTKIAVFVDQLVLGGVQKGAIEEVRLLRKLGYQVQIVSLMRKGFKPEYKKLIKDTPLIFLSDRYPQLFRNSFKFPFFSFFSTLHLFGPILAPFFVKKNEWDIIISHGTTTCLTALSLSKTRSIKYIAVIHDPMEYILKHVYKETPLKYFFGILSPILYTLERAIVKNAQQVAVNSYVHRSFIKKTYHLDPFVLIFGAKPLPRLPRKRQNYLLAVSRWDKGKNPLLLLRIIKKLKRASLVITGSWTRKEDLNWFKSQIDKFQLTKRIKLYPSVSERQLKNLYSQALVFIHPNFEAFGLGGLEAAAHGCPIIIPKGSGITEIFENGKDGFFPQKANLRYFLPAVKTIVSNPQKTTQMGKSAYHKAKFYSWQQHTQKLVSLIEKALPTNRKTIVALETGHASEQYLSGGDKLLEKMARYFPPNFKLTVIIPQIGTEHWQQAQLPNTTLNRLPKTLIDNRPNPLWIFIAYLIRIWQSYWKLRKIGNLDVIYSSTNILPDIAPAFFFKLTHQDIPWIARVHHLIPFPTRRPGNPIINTGSYLMQQVSNMMIKKMSNNTIALNHRLAKTLIKHNFPKKTIEVIGAGIDFEKINQAKPFKNKSFDAVHVGRIHPSKGTSDLVKIWQNVTVDKPEAKAVIIGGGSEEENQKLKNQIKKARLSKKLFIAGYLSEKQLNSTLKSAKIFLFTDHEAGWGLAIAEAMAAGLPVVGYNLEIFGDVFRQGYVTVPLGDTKKFAEKILYLLDHQENYQILQKQALAQARILSWEKTSQRFNKIMQETLKN